MTPKDKERLKKAFRAVVESDPNPDGPVGGKCGAQSFRDAVEELLGGEDFYAAIDKDPSSLEKIIKTLEADVETNKKSAPKNKVPKPGM